MNYDNKRFKVVQNTPNGETSDNTIFTYKQQGQILTCTYSNEKIEIGHLLGIVDEEGKIDMSYHQVNSEGDIRTGVCKSYPEIMENGKVRLREEWQWTNGDKSFGESTLEEI